MWTSKPEELSSDSLTTVMVLAQKLKLHNPVLTAAPGIHEEMCLQTTRRNNKPANSSNNEDTLDGNKWGRDSMSTSASSTPSSVCSANDKTSNKSPFLRRRQNQKAFECGSQKLSDSTLSQLEQYKLDQIGTDSPYQKHHLSIDSDSHKKSRALSRVLGGQRRPLLSQTAVDIDTENDTDTETSNDTEIICTSDDEIRSFGMEAMSNSDYDDAFESISDSSAREDNVKSSGNQNLKSRLTNSCNQRQEILRTRMSPSPTIKPRKENVRGAKVKEKPTAMSSVVPPNSPSSTPFRHPQSNVQNLDTKFCRFSPLRQRTGRNDADNESQIIKSHPQKLGKTQISDRQDDGLGASVDDNDDDATLEDARHKPDSWNIPESRKKRNDGKKSRNFQLKKQGDENGSDTSNTSSSSSLSYSPFTNFSPADTSSPLSQHVNKVQYGENSDQEGRLQISHNNGSSAANETTDFGQKLDLLQSELVSTQKIYSFFFNYYLDIIVFEFLNEACLYY